MDIIVTGKHLDVTDPIRSYATQRLEKVSRYYDRASKAEVVLDKNDANTFAVEIIVHVDRHEHFVAQDRSDDLYRSIDQAADKVARQVHDHKEKVRNHKG